jgi:hypothetical protein
MLNAFIAPVADLGFYATQLGLLPVLGLDAQAFLQSQLSNDIQRVDGNTAQLSSYNNPKGRVIAVLHVVKLDQGFGLIAPYSELPALQARLKKFVMRSKVQFGETLPVFGEVSDAALPAWQQQGSAYGLGNRRVLHWQALTSPLLPSEAWHLEDIAAGLPWLVGGAIEQFVVQALNLVALGGVDFKKGCYPGQEIVARLHYLGQYKRHMNAFFCEQPVVAGDKLSQSNSVQVVMSVPYLAGSAVLVVTA